VRNEQTVLPLLVLQRELCSSPRALVPTLRNSQWIGPSLADLVQLAESIAVTAKMRALLELARHVQDRILIFTEYRGTQDALVEFLQANGYEAAAFHGGLRGRERDRLLDWFRATSGILVSTEAGGQGINLQFCHVVVNFDLPWNPMRIEQRIGRVHRIGQTKPVQIYNLFAVDTVEADILRLLHEKIDLFRTVIGELDVILRHIERRGSLEKRLIDIFFWEDDHDNMVRRLDQLGNEFLAARRRLQWPGVPAVDAVPTGEHA
jgi:SNF2 family DNA or RNA helicase